LKIHLLKQVHGNFGDDLNRWLWHELLADVWDDDAEVLFVGIGTILDQNLPPARVRVVFGTGVGYTAAPRDLSSNGVGWRIYGVRGPLTARALNIDPALAMTDAAILLATLPQFQSLPRHGTLFVPHWKSVRYGYWQRICTDLGIEFLDPCRDSKWVVGRIASARKVVAESMHGAIIADAFRVPWVPVALSREISPFKWVDWASSMDVSYEPTCLPASTRVERLRNIALKWSVHSNVPDYPSSQAIRAGGTLQFKDRNRLMSDFEQIGRRINQTWRWNTSIGIEVVLKRLARADLGSSAVMLETAAAHFAKLVAQEGSLSSDHSHHRALEHTLSQFEAFKRDCERGEFAVR
jgi:hypothetical protein